MSSSEANMSNMTESSSSPTTVNTPNNSRLSVARIATCGCLGAVICLGNALTLVAFIKSKSLHKRAYVLLVSLCIADLLVGICACVEMFAELAALYRWNTPYHAYVLVAFENASMLASIATLAAISVERLWAIVFPFKHRSASYIPYVIITALPWVFSIFIAFLYLASFFRPSPELRDAYLYTYVISPIAIVTGMCVTYFVLGCRVMSNRIEGTCNNDSLRDKKLAVTLLLVTLVSMATWLPRQLYVALWLFCHACDVESKAANEALYFVQFLNSGLNFVIYMVRMPDFQRAVKTLFRYRSARVGVESSKSVKMSLEKPNTNGSRQVQESRGLVLRDLTAVS